MSPSSSSSSIIDRLVLLVSACLWLVSLHELLVAGVSTPTVSAVKLGLPLRLRPMPSSHTQEKVDAALERRQQNSRNPDNLNARGTDTTKPEYLAQRAESSVVLSGVKVSQLKEWFRYGQPGYDERRWWQMFEDWVAEVVSASQRRPYPAKPPKWFVMP